MFVELFLRVDTIFNKAFVGAYFNASVSILDYILFNELHVYTIQGLSLKTSYFSVYLILSNKPNYIFLFFCFLKTKKLLSCEQTKIYICWTGFFPYIPTRAIILYSRLSLSRNRRDPQKQFEISVLRHIRLCSIEEKPI